MSMSNADFELKHEAVDELKRLAAHPVQEVERLEQTRSKARRRRRS